MRRFNIITILHICLLLTVPAIVHAQDELNIKVESVTIQGNIAFSTKRIKNLMNIKKSSYFSHSYFDRQIIDDDIIAIAKFYQDNGYFEVKVWSEETYTDDDSTKVTLVIDIFEGKPTKIMKVEFIGNDTVSDEMLASLISIKEGDNFQRNEIDVSNITILTHYATLGFPDAEIEPEVTVDNENKQVSTKFNIQENGQFTIQDIQIKGLEKTQEQVITREINFKSGDMIDYSRLLESQRNIYETGLFLSVYVHPSEPVNGGPGVKDVIIELKEKDSIRMSVAAGYNTEENITGKLEAYTINLMGAGRRLGAAGKISFIRRMLSSSFTSPRIFNTKWQMDINAGWNYFEEPSYDLSKVFGLMSVGRKIGDNTLFRVQYRQDHSRAQNITIIDLPNEMINDISSLEFSLRHDRRNSLFNASKGLYWDISSEFGRSFSDQNVSFLRTIGRIKYYYPLRRSTILATSLEIGHINSAQGVLGLPLQERFYTGGGRTIRGYNYNRLGPLDENGKPLGGKIKIVWNVFEVRKKIYKILDGTVFCDAGNVWKNTETFDITDIRLSSGFGLRLNTPVGVVRGDYGFRIDKRPDESTGEFYFSMGQAF